MPTKETMGLNHVVLLGEVSSELVTRDLADESTVSTFDLTTTTDQGRFSVPVSVEGVPAVVEVGAHVCVIGRVRRRFFRSGSSVASRTEVVAHVICPTRRRAQVRKAVDAVIDDLSGFLDA
jgi:single-strand DNA-binding protein